MIRVPLASGKYEFVDVELLTLFVNYGWMACGF